MYSTDGRVRVGYGCQRILQPGAKSRDVGPRPLRHPRSDAAFLLQERQEEVLVVDLLVPVSPG
jgi:hypothetical protein